MCNQSKIKCVIAVAIIFIITINYYHYYCFSVLALSPKGNRWLNPTYKREFKKRITFST